MKVPITKDVDPASLAAQFTKALGRPVAVSTRNPGQKSNDGATLPGVVILLDGVTGEELDVQDQQVVNAVLTNHVVPAAGQTPAQALLDALAGAGNNVATIANALKDYANAVATREALQRVKRSPVERP